jgi:hypothetical protein
MNRAPFETLPGKCKILGLVTFSLAITVVIGLGGYFSINSPRLNLRRLSCLWLTVFFYSNLIFWSDLHLG